MAKALIVVNGPMGVGNTTVAQALYRRLERSVWLDGDWCWMMSPWVVSAENKRTVEDNITYLLRAYLTNESFDDVVLSWVMHRPEIIDSLLLRLSDLSFAEHRVSVVCSEEALRARLLADGREGHVVDESVRRLPLYHDMQTRKVSATDRSVADTVEEVLTLVGAGCGPGARSTRGK